MSTEPLFAQPARKLLTPLTSPTTAPKPAAATMAYCTKGFYDGQYSAACGTTCGSTSDQAATPDAMPAISLTVGSSDTNTGASMINCHPWKQKQPGQHLDQRKVLASLTTTHCPTLNGGNSHAAKHYPGPKGGCISDTTCGSIKRGELRGSTSPVTALEAHAKDLAERGIPATTVGMNSGDFSTCTYITANDVATRWNATDCACNGGDTVFGIRDYSGMSHGGYHDTINVSAGRCRISPATASSNSSLRAISGNGCSNPLISTPGPEVVDEPTEQHELGGTTGQQAAKADDECTGRMEGGAAREPCIHTGDRGGEGSAQSPFLPASRDTTSKGGSDRATASLMIASAHGKGGSNSSMTPAPNRRSGIMAKHRPVSKRVCNGTTASSMPGVEPGKGGSSDYRHQHPHSIDTLSLSLSNFVVMVLFHATASTRNWVSGSGIYLPMAGYSGPTLCESTQGGVIGDGTPNKGEATPSPRGHPEQEIRMPPRGDTYAPNQLLTHCVHGQ